MSRAEQWHRVCRLGPADLSGALGDDALVSSSGLVCGFTMTGRRRLIREGKVVGSAIRESGKDGNS
jgi:hypothetical protein